ncbi:MAG: hypothetical protein IT450_18795 [Phycisphaerales bacterium]|nr:hypothetical protein [Phycisphaerales bacterium]
MNIRFRFSDVSGLVLSVLVCCGSAAADVVTVSGPGPASYDVEARARWGNTGFEGILFTPGADPNMNPGGTPVWNPNLFYSFDLTYLPATNTATWSIDFNRDGDYLDSQESVTATWGSGGMTFNRLNLFMQGNSDANGSNNAEVQGFTVNGTNFGNFTTVGQTGQLFSQLYADTSGSFGSITATGQMRLFGNSAFSSERPRVWVQLGNVVVPAPGAALLGVLGLSIAGWVKRRMA